MFSWIFDTAINVGALALIYLASLGNTYATNLLMFWQWLTLFLGVAAMFVCKDYAHDISNKYGKYTARHKVGCIFSFIICLFAAANGFYLCASAYILLGLVSFATWGMVESNTRQG